MTTTTTAPAFPRCEPYPGSVNRYGETERIGDVEVTHWFSRALRSRYHFVTAGDPANPPLVFLHGLPETWYAWHNQIRDLSDTYYCVAVDLKGYGQSEKTLNSDYSFAHCAFETGVLLDNLGIDTFSVVSHDRGTVVADHLFGLPNKFNARIHKYVRMQQSANHPHAEPRPPHPLFGSAAGPLLFSHPELIDILYATRPLAPPPTKVAVRFANLMNALYVPLGVQKKLFHFIMSKQNTRASAGGATQPGGAGMAGHQYVYQPISAAVLDRLKREWSFPGVSDAVPLTFRQTNFDIEYEDRRDFLFDKMDCPVLFLQGALDPGQPKSDYEGLTEMRPNFSVRFIEEAGHFVHLECPGAVTQAMREFLAD